MWNRFKKSKRGSDVKDSHLMSADDGQDIVATQRAGDGDIQKSCLNNVDGEVSSPDVASVGGTPSKNKVKRKLSLFGSKSRGKTTPSDNCINLVAGVESREQLKLGVSNGEKDNVGKRLSLLAGDSVPDAAKCSDEVTSSGSKDQTTQIKRQQQHGGEPSKALTASDKRQSKTSTCSADSTSGVIHDDSKALLSRTVRGTVGCGKLDVPDSVDDDDEVFHRQPTTLSTFAATASVDVIAKPSPPKMKRRTKPMTGNGHATETETRRSKLSKPLTSSATRPKVEPVEVPTVPITTPAENDNKSSNFRSPSSGNSSSAVAAGGKRVPPPVPVRRSSTRNGNADVVLSPSRDSSNRSVLPTCSEGLTVSTSRTLYSVSSMKSSPGDSGSDDTEGKESGYVTLDDLQAQLMRSSWSSDDREVEQTTSSNGITKDNEQLATCGGMTDSFCGSEVSRMMTPDSLMTSSQSSATLSRPPTTLNIDEGDDDVSWPAPPSPIDHVTTKEIKKMDEKVVDVPSIMATPVVRDDSPTPVVTLTFTVKLDGDIIKNQSKNLIHQSPTTITGDVILHENIQTTLPRSAVVIPDVLVCAGATTSASFDRANSSQITRQMAASASMVAVMDARCRSDSDEQRQKVSESDHVKESRSCQTEPSNGFCVQCRSCNQTADQEASVTSSHDSDREQTKPEGKPEGNDVTVVDDAKPNSCQCHCRVDDGSYLRPLVTRVYTNKSPSTPKNGQPQGASTMTTVRQTSEELTHMSWNEVLEEAQTMGIELHPPLAKTTRNHRRPAPIDCNKSPSIHSCHSSTIDVESPNCRSPRRHRLPIAYDDEHLEVIEQSNVSAMDDSVSKRSSKTSFRDLFRWPSKLFSSKKKTSTSSAAVKRSKSLEQPYRIQSRNLPAPPMNSSKNRRSEHLTDGHNRMSRACSRYSASSCPSTADRVGRPGPPSRTISVVSSSTHCGGQSMPDYFLGSTCSAGVGTHGGSLPAFHRHRVTSSSTSGGDQLMTSSFDVGDLDDACCVSPSINSFSSSTCSRTTPWRNATAGLPSTPTMTTSTCSRNSSGMFSSLSAKCSSWKGNKTDFVSSLSELQNYGWYWGALGFDEAEDKLANRRDGSFIVRDSSDERFILSLSFRSLGSTHHTRIEHYKGSFSFCSQSPPVISNLAPASTVVEFIEGAMAASRAGQCLYYLRPRAPGLAPAPVRLLYPVSRFRCMHSLQHLCKFAVLRHVRLDMVDRLPVPPRLKEYLKHGRPTMD